MRRRLTSITYKQNGEAKTLAVVDRLKFRDSLNWIQDIKGADLNSIKQLSNHALLLNVRKQGNEFECYFTSITSKTKSVALINVIEAYLMRLHNGEFRYIPKVIYKYTFTRELLLNLFNLEHQNSIDLKEQIRLWDSPNVLDDWSNIIKVHECHYIDLDLIKESGILNVSIFEDKLSSSNWDIEVMKNLITNDRIYSFLLILIYTRIIRYVKKNETQNFVNKFNIEKYLIFSKYKNIVLYLIFNIIFWNKFI